MLITLIYRIPYLYLNSAYIFLKRNTYLSFNDLYEIITEQILISYLNSESAQIKRVLHIYLIFFIFLDCRHNLCQISNEQNINFNCHMHCSYF